MYAKPRSCNMELLEGMTDGTFKRANMNWCNASPETVAVRKQMSGVWHGFNEISSKMTPDARTTSAGYADVTPADKENV
jgi:hypothetical protein